MRRSMLNWVVILGLLCGTMPLTTGCGTEYFDDFFEALDDLDEDLDDSDDFEDLGEALDDFFDEIADD